MRPVVKALTRFSGNCVAYVCAIALAQANTSCRGNPPARLRELAVVLGLLGSFVRYNGNVPELLGVFCSRLECSYSDSRATTA